MPLLYTTYTAVESTTTCLVAPISGLKKHLVHKQHKKILLSPIIYGQFLRIKTLTSSAMYFICIRTVLDISFVAHTTKR